MSSDDILSHAEFNPSDELIVTWPKWNYRKAEGFNQEPYIINIIKGAEDAVKVRINVDDPLLKLRAELKLKQSGVPLENITFFNQFTNDIWCRDYGPLFIEKNGNLAIVDFLYYGWLARPMDNLYPTFYGIKNKIEYNFSSNFYLCLQGGNYMTDGQARALVAENRFMHLVQIPVYQMKK